MSKVRVAARRAYRRSRHSGRSSRPVGPVRRPSGRAKQPARWPGAAALTRAQQPAHWSGAAALARRGGPRPAQRSSLRAQQPARRPGAARTTPKHTIAPNLSTTQKSTPHNTGQLLPGVGSDRIAVVQQGRIHNKGLVGSEHHKVRIGTNRKTALTLQTREPSRPAGHPVHNTFQRISAPPCLSPDHR